MTWQHTYSYCIEWFCRITCNCIILGYALPQTVVFIHNPENDVCWPFRSALKNYFRLPASLFRYEYPFQPYSKIGTMIKFTIHLIEVRINYYSKKWWYPLPNQLKVSQNFEFIIYLVTVTDSQSDTYHFNLSHYSPYATSTILATILIIL